MESSILILRPFVTEFISELALIESSQSAKPCSHPICFNVYIFYLVFIKILAIFVRNFFPPNKTQEFPEWNAAMSFQESRDLLKPLLNKSRPCSSLFTIYI